MTEPFDQLYASVVRLHPFVGDDRVDQVIFSVPKPAHRIELRRVVWASLRQLDTA